jgi:hypothetical protein
VTIVPDRGPNGGYQGKCVRSAPVNELTFDENTQDKTEEIVDTCARLEKLTPILGSDRVESSEYYIRSQNNCIELVAGECAERVLHPDHSVPITILSKPTRFQKSRSPRNPRSRR